MSGPAVTVEPYEHGMLDVGDGNQVYWETCGNPDGKPALFVHGGPGGGCGPNHRRVFHPRRYRAVLFDQRGCGRSTPHASDPATDMSRNTTEHLLADMELLREHLGVDRWLVFGGSWGTTLGLAYAERHPERVSEMVLVSVTTSGRSAVEWLYRGVARFFPQEWERFRAAACAGRDGDTGDDTPGDTGHDLVAAYARLMDDPDPRVRRRAARAWAAWEDAVLSLEPNRRRNTFGDRADDALVALVRICAHYFANAAWLDEDALLRDAGRLAGIPGVLVHGRLDLSCPLATAWELSRAWPGAELVAVPDAGHTGGAATNQAVGAALTRFATP